jgi:hypothetical protein
VQSIVFSDSYQLLLIFPVKEGELDESSQTHMVPIKSPTMCLTSKFIHSAGLTRATWATAPPMSSKGQTSRRAGAGADSRVQLEATVGMSLSIGGSGPSPAWARPGAASAQKAVDQRSALHQGACRCRRRRDAGRRGDAGQKDGGNSLVSLSRAQES